MRLGFTFDKHMFSLDHTRGEYSFEWHVTTFGQSLSRSSEKAKSRVLPMSSPSSLIFFLFRFFLHSKLRLICSFIRELLLKKVFSELEMMSCP